MENRKATINFGEVASGMHSITLPSNQQQLE